MYWWLQQIISQHQLWVLHDWHTLDNAHCIIFNHTWVLYFLSTLAVLHTFQVLSLVSQQTSHIWQLVIEPTISNESKNCSKGKHLVYLVDFTYWRKCSQIESATVLLHYTLVLVRSCHCQYSSLKCESLQHSCIRSKRSNSMFNCKPLLCPNIAYLWAPSCFNFSFRWRVLGDLIFGYTWEHNRFSRETYQLQSAVHKPQHGCRYCMECTIYGFWCGTFIVPHQLWALNTIYIYIYMCSLVMRNFKVPHSVLFPVPQPQPSQTHVPQEVCIV